MAITKPQRFDALIVDPDAATKMRLKQASSSVGEFDKVMLVNSLSEATSKLNTGTPIDVCFLSAAMDRASIDNFIIQAKAHKNGQDSAYVCVMKGNAQEATNIAGNVISGFDGMLFEPYSVDQLVELTRIAARVRKERSGAREQAALKIIVQDFISLIDKIAFVKKQGVDPAGLTRKLRTAAETLSRLQPDSFQMYFGIAVEEFCAAPIPAESVEAKSYAGASSRIQKRQKEKLVQEAERLASDAL